MVRRFRNPGRLKMLIDWLAFAYLGFPAYSDAGLRFRGRALGDTSYNQPKYRGRNNYQHHSSGSLV